jgi:hypothetical protein
MWDLLAANLALIRAVLLSEVTLPVLSLISQSLDTFVDELFVSPSTTAVFTIVREEVTEEAPSAILLHCRHTHN